jgi:hypothetical protein
MLVYDANERITAGDALRHPAFELLRAYEEMWRRHGRIGTFSTFVLTYPLPRVNRPTQPPIADRILALQAPPEPPAEPPAQPRKDEECHLVDSRLKAAKRIKQYKMKRYNIADQKPPKAGLPTLKFGVATICKLGAQRMSRNAHIVQPNVRKVSIFG